MNQSNKLSCSVCNKHLNPLMEYLYTCKCKGVYCRENHMYNHNCTYDFHKEASQRLKSKLQLIVGSKLR